MTEAPIDMSDDLYDTKIYHLKTLAEAAHNGDWEYTITGSKSIRMFHAHITPKLVIEMINEILKIQSLENKVDWNYKELIETRTENKYLKNLLYEEKKKFGQMRLTLTNKYAREERPYRKKTEEMEKRLYEIKNKSKRIIKWGDQVINDCSDCYICEKHYEDLMGEL